MKLIRRVHNTYKSKLLNTHSQSDISFVQYNIKATLCDVLTNHHYKLSMYKREDEQSNTTSQHFLINIIITLRIREVTIRNTRDKK